MDRRRFLSFAAGGAAGAALASSVSCVQPFLKKQPALAARLDIPTTCEMCVNKCSIIAVVENGKISKLNPNPESPRSRGMVCARGNAGLQQVYDPARLKKTSSTRRRSRGRQMENRRLGRSFRLCRRQTGQGEGAIRPPGNDVVLDRKFC